MTRAELLSLHAELSDQCAGEQRTLGRLLGQERRAKTELWPTVQGSDKARDNGAQLHTINITEEVFRCTQEVKALTTELENVRLQIAYGGYDTEG